MFFSKLKENLKKTKEAIDIPATKVPGFKASKTLKDLVR